MKATTRSIIKCSVLFLVTFAFTQNFRRFHTFLNDTVIKDEKTQLYVDVSQNISALLEEVTKKINALLEEDQKKLKRYEIMEEKINAILGEVPKNLERHRIINNVDGIANDGNKNEKEKSFSGTLYAPIIPLKSRGAEISISIEDIPHFVQHESIRIVTEPSIDRVPRADGDEAMQYIVDRLDVSARCQEDPSLIVVDVGGLYGDFGLLAAARGCRTHIFEPQISYARQIAQSALLNPRLVGKVGVHHAAVSNAPWVSFDFDKSTGGTATVLQTSSDDPAKIPTEQLDLEFPKERILFLKVDVEGNEDEILATTTKLFRDGRILNAVFEYTPNQFKGRGTDYETFLSRLYDNNAQSCYALHRNQRKIFFIPKGQENTFYQKMFDTALQTDVYCMFGDEENKFLDAPVWDINSNLLA